MTQTKRLQPSSEGLLVLFPETRRPLSPQGEEVTLTTYWRRRLRSGDVVEVAAPKSPSSSKPSTKTPARTAEKA